MTEKQEILFDVKSRMIGPLLDLKDGIITWLEAEEKIQEIVSEALDRYVDPTRDVF